MTSLLTTGLHFVYQNLWYYGSYCINAMAFDVGTNIMVSMFGYSFNAGFMKNKPQKGGTFSIKEAAKRITKSTTKGSVVVRTFNGMVNWLIDNSFTIIWSCIIAIILIVVIRYLFTHLFYTASSKRAKRK